MQRKILVALAGLALLAALIVLFIAPASAQTQPLPPAPQVPRAQATAVPTTAAAVKPSPPVAVLEIVPVAAGVVDPNVITATLGATTTIYLGSSDLPNVSIGVPVHVSASVPDAKNPAKKYTWTLTAPVGSKAALKDPSAAATEFTPDLAGWYKVDVVAANDAGNGPMDSVQIHADTYVGVTAGNCKQCHASKVEEWSKTGHATKFQREIDGGSNPATSRYAESCTRCHTTGYYPGAANGGFADVQSKTGWKFPDQKQIQTGKGNWDAVPADLKNVANIQCESCHGPAKEHVTKGTATMAASLGSATCNVCHAAGGKQVNGIELTYSAHTEESAPAWNEPTGPSRQACVRCHSAAGYVSFTQDPKNMASWNNTKEALGCSTCHDPHDDKNTFQLRVVGKPLEVPFDAKDVGLSATCETCHNSRTKPEEAVKGSYPHYSSAAEFLSNTGGVTYGQKISDSPHGQILGAGPVPDPSDKTGKTLLYDGATPGPCVTCHMTPKLEDAKDPNYLKVGAHSFNLVSPDGKFEYTAACKSCHSNIKDDFNLPAKADYDGNGKVEGVQDEVKGLLNVVWKALEAKGFKKVDTGYPYATVPQNADDKAKNAWYNFRTVYGVMWGTATGNGNEGKAQAIHNFKRAVELLQLSYKDLTGSDIPNATVLK